MIISAKNIEFSLLDIWVGDMNVYGFAIGRVETDSYIRSLLGVDYHSDTKEFVVCILFRYISFWQNNKSLV